METALLHLSLTHLVVSLLKAITVYWLQYVLCQITCGWGKFTDTRTSTWTGEKGLRERKNADWPQHKLWPHCTDKNDAAAPLHSTRFSKGKGDFLQESWLGVEGAILCFPWAVTGTVSIQGCFSEECIPNFGCVFINVSWKKAWTQRILRMENFSSPLFQPLSTEVTGKCLDFKNRCTLW